MGNLDFDEKKLKNAQFLLTENGEYLKAQSQQIRLGKEEGMDVSVYSNPEFDWLQMEQIRMGSRIRWMSPCMRIPHTVMTP